MAKNYFNIILLSIFLLIGCNTKQNKLDYEHLAVLDTLLQSTPEKVCDSLKGIDIKKLSQYNYGYYLLLDVISKDKTYFIFSSDSLIKLSSKLLAHKKNEYPLNYARSLMYRGIIRYRMGITDSTAYEPIKEAADFLEKKQINNPLVLSFCYEYLAIIHDENGDAKYSIQYFNKSIKNTKKYGNKEYLFKSYVYLCWVYMKIEKFSIAKQYIDTLNNFKNKSILQTASINYILSTYYEHNKETKKALQINLQLLKDEKSRKENPSITLRKIAKNYKALERLDSALYYAEKAEECKQHPNYYLNFLYYKDIGEISGQLKLWQKSAIAYKKAYQLKEKAISKELDKQIMSLEKKYDLKEAENKALQLRNRLIFSGFVSLLLIILLVTSTIIFHQRGKQAVMKMRLTEQKNQLLEQEKINMERNLIEKEFILPMYQQISQRNANIKAFLSDLMTNTHLTKNTQLSQKVSETYQNFISALNINADNFLTNEKFTEFTGIECESCKLLNENEKILLVFAAIKLDNRQIAVLFNTTESSIRGRKAKLRMKLENQNIDIKNIII